MTGPEGRCRHRSEASGFPTTDEDENGPHDARKALNEALASSHVDDEMLAVGLFAPKGSGVGMLAGGLVGDVVGGALSGAVGSALGDLAGNGAGKWETCTTYRATSSWRSPIPGLRCDAAGLPVGAFNAPVPGDPRRSQGDEEGPGVGPGSGAAGSRRRWIDPPQRKRNPMTAAESVIHELTAERFTPGLGMRRHSASGHTGAVRATGRNRSPARLRTTALSTRGVSARTYGEEGPPSRHRFGRGNRKVDRLDG